MGQGIEACPDAESTGESLSGVIYGMMTGNERMHEQIQLIVNELLELPHAILLRYLTYWSAVIDKGRFGIDVEVEHEEWRKLTDSYASADSEQLRYMFAGCMALKMGRMLRGMKQAYPDLLPMALHEVHSWKDKHYITLPPTIREEIDNTWKEPETWSEGKIAGLAFVPLIQMFMHQYEAGQMYESAGNTLYLLERIGTLWFNKPRLFDPDANYYCSSYDLLMQAACHILVSIMKDNRTKTLLREDIPWHLRTINMIYRRIFESFDTQFDNLMYSKVDKDMFAEGYNNYVLSGKVNMALHYVFSC